MSKTPDLDKTIATLQEMLEETKAKKDRLAITDRLIRAYALKYRHDVEGKGGKFNALPSSAANMQGSSTPTNGATHGRDPNIQ